MNFLRNWIKSLTEVLKDASHLPTCGTAYRGCAPNCPKEVREREESKKELERLKIAFPIGARVSSDYGFGTVVRVDYADPAEWYMPAVWVLIDGEHKEEEFQGHDLRLI